MSTRRQISSVALFGLLGLAFIHRGFFFGEVFAGRDVFRLFIPDSTFMLRALRGFEIPLWNPYQRLGQPFLATLYAQVLYPPRWIGLLFGPIWAISVEQMIHEVVATLGMFLLCRRLRRSVPASSVAAASFGLSLLFFCLAVQQNVASSAAWSGWLLDSALRLRDRPTRKGVARLSCFIALSFLGGSPETLCWQLISLAAIAWPRNVRAAVAGSAAGLLGLGLSAATALPGLEMALHSTRGSFGPDNLAWSVSYPQILSLFWIDADLPHPGYWAPDQQYIVSLFFGSITCLLAVLGAVRAKRARRLGAIGMCWLLLSLGSHFPPARLLLGAPPFALFRYPVKYFVGAAFCGCILSAFGLDRLAWIARRNKPSALSAGLIVASTFALLFAGTRWIRPPLFRRDAIGGFTWFVLFLAALAVYVFCFPGGPGRGRKRRWAIARLAMLELLCSHAIVKTTHLVSAERLSAPSRLGEIIRRLGDGGRLSVELTSDLVPFQLDTATAEDTVRYIELSRDSLVPVRYVEEGIFGVEGYGAPEPERGDELFEAADRSSFDFFGTTFFVRRSDPPFPNLIKVPTPLDLPALFRSQTAAPQAFVVHQARTADDAAALQALRAPEEPWRNTAFLAAPSPGLPAQPRDCGSTASMRRRSSMSIEIELDACSEGYLVVTDRHYPGWRATLDGRPAEILRADLLARAVRVPKGHHHVSMVYRPPSFWAGLSISIASAAALLWALL